MKNSVNLYGWPIPFFHFVFFLKNNHTPAVQLNLIIDEEGSSDLSLNKEIFFPGKLEMPHRDPEKQSLTHTVRNS